MAFLTGLYLVDAPAAALNNGKGEDTTAPVKKIFTPEGVFPYVSAQSFRFWLRSTLNDHPEWSQHVAPVYSPKKAKQQAYTEGNPIRYWDDDLLGYMRAEKDDKENLTLTRVSPLRTSTLVALAPSRPVSDFGVMVRQEGDPVLHGHEFYRAVLKGTLSLDLDAAGTFSAIHRTGFLNLNDVLKASAREAGATDLAGNRLRLPLGERLRRVEALLWGLGHLEGGAKQTLHYTDVAPAFVLLAFLKGGNNPFSYLVQAGVRGEPMVHREALDQAFRVFGDELLAPVLIGRAAGFFDSADEAFTVARDAGVNLEIVGHPRKAFDRAARLLRENPEWLD